MAVGKGVSSHRVGDHVAGFVQGGTFPDYGAYAEYVRTPAELAWVVPEGTMSHEEAAALGCAYVVFAWLLGCPSESTSRFWTAVQALYNPSRLGLIEPPLRVDGKQWVFIYGGSSKSSANLARLLYGLLNRTAQPPLVSTPRNLHICLATRLPRLRHHIISTYASRLGPTL